MAGSKPRITYTKDEMLSLRAQAQTPPADLPAIPGVTDRNTLFGRQDVRRQNTTPHVESVNASRPK